MRYSLALILAALLSACGLMQPVKDETSDWSAARLYQEAKEEFSDGNYEKAIKLYEKLESRFPYGQYATQSQLDIAYTYYKQNEPESAIAAADRFIKLHPNHPNVDYAYYLKGLANFIGETGLITALINKDISERDPKSALESFDSFKELVTRFPNSKYAADSRQRMQYLANMLALHEIHVADYYYRKGAYEAAINRAQGVLRDFAKTPATKDALVILAKSYDALGLKELRDDANRVLQKNFQSAAAAKPVEVKPWWQLWQ